MTPEFLKQAEIFAFLTMFLLVAVFFMESAKTSQNTVTIDKAQFDQMTGLSTQLASCQARFSQLSGLPAQLDECRNQLADCQIQFAQFTGLSNQLAACQASYDRLKRENEELQDRINNLFPPIIILSEADDEGYHFAFGKAEVPYKLRKDLEEQFIPLLDEWGKTSFCDAIEVIGHTDEVPVTKTSSNLDSKLILSFQRGEVGQLKPGSNLDLGIIRALAIIDILKQSQWKGNLTGIKYFFPYSAGQLILPDKTIATYNVQNLQKEDRSRRRIEIRMFRYSTQNIQEHF